MNRNRVLVLALGLLAALLVAACGSEAPTATPVPPAPTIAALATDTAVPAAPTPLPATPAAQVEDNLQRVQSAGHMVVGTSADYPPFEYYNLDFQLDGFCNFTHSFAAMARVCFQRWLPTNRLPAARHLNLPSPTSGLSHATWSALHGAG